MALYYTQARHPQELEQILRLQQCNLPECLNAREKLEEGFLTVRHTLQQLHRMNEACGHIIARDGKLVVGYALCMSPSFEGEIPVLDPMFEQLKRWLPDTCRYMVMGQVCVDKAYRGQGIFRGLYRKMQEVLKGTYDTIITEVDAANLRSLTAHKAIGFTEMGCYTSGERVWHLIQLPTSQI